MNYIKCPKCGREEPAFDYAHICGPLKVKPKMNKRIQELWDKAAESTAAYPSGQNNSWETQVNFMEKFAELIVRESAKIAAQDPLFLNHAENDKHMERDIINHSFKKIKKEFGIE
jgi:hypothetical protein